MPRGRPKGSKNKAKNSGDLTNFEEIEVREDYQFVSGQPMISNINPFTKKLSARIYGSLNPNYIEVVDADGSVSYKGSIDLSYTADKKPYRRLPDGRCFDMGGWPMDDPDAEKPKTRKPRAKTTKPKATTTKKNTKTTRKKKD